MLRLPMLVFVAACALANFLTSRYGFVSVGFGLQATAGTYAAGVALVARDYVHERGGWPAVGVAIGLGGLLSWATATPALALASTVAFAASELADGLIYAPLRERRWRLAVIGSSAVGALVDTVLFLSLAFGTAALTAQALTGQLVAKVLWVAVPVALVGHQRRQRGRAVPVGL